MLLILIDDDLSLSVILFSKTATFVFTRCYCCGIQDKFKFCGCKTYRYLFLFEKGLLIAKRKEDGSFQVKASIMVFDKHFTCFSSEFLLHIR